MDHPTMNIVVDRIERQEPITILRLKGRLDSYSYLDLVARAKEVYETGGRNIIVDMNDVSAISSSGLVALHSVATLMGGDEAPDLESARAAVHAIERGRKSGLQQHVKLLRPQPRVAQTLSEVEFTSFLEIHSNLEAALASFS